MCIGELANTGLVSSKERARITRDVLAWMPKSSAFIRLFSRAECPIGKERFQDMTEERDGSAVTDCYAVPPHLIMDVTKMQRLAKRLQRAESLLQRAYDGMQKEHWQEGESEAEVCQAIRHFLDDSPSA